MSRRGRDLTALEDAREDLRVFNALRLHYTRARDTENRPQISALMREISRLFGEVERLRDEVRRAADEVPRYEAKVADQASIVRQLERDPRAVVYRRGGKTRVAKGDSRKAKALRLRRQLRKLELELAAENAEAFELGDTVEAEGIVAESREQGWYWHGIEGGAVEGPFESAYEALRAGGVSTGAATRAVR